MKRLAPFVTESEYAKKYLTTGEVRQLTLYMDKVDGDGPTYPHPPFYTMFEITEYAPNKYHPQGQTMVVMFTFRDWKPWHRKKGWAITRYRKKTLYFFEGIDTENIIDRLIAGEYTARGLTMLAPDSLKAGDLSIVKSENALPA